MRACRKTRLKGLPIFFAIRHFQFVITTGHPLCEITSKWFSKLESSLSKDIRHLHFHTVSAAMIIEQQSLSQLLELLPAQTSISFTIETWEIMGTMLFLDELKGIASSIKWREMYLEVEVGRPAETRRKTEGKRSLTDSVYV